MRRRKKRRRRRSDQGCPRSTSLKHKVRSGYVMQFKPALLAIWFLATLCLVVAVISTQNSVCDCNEHSTLRPIRQERRSSNVSEKQDAKPAQRVSKEATRVAIQRLNNGPFGGNLARTLPVEAFGRSENRKIRRATRSMLLEQTPLVFAKPGQRPELGCHLFGLPLELRERKWTVRTQANPARAKYDTIEQLDEPSSAFVAAAANSESGADLAEEVSGAEDDLVSLVFWFKDNNPTPIYTLDARQVPLGSLNSANLSQTRLNSAASRSRDESGLRSQIGRSGSELIDSRANINKQLLARAKHWQRSSSSALKFDISSEFPILKLRLDEVNAKDTGNYKCRIDFKRSPTINQLVRLLVQVPISWVEISGDSRGSVSVTQAENERLEFTCTASEGSPKPRLNWLVRWKLSPLANATNESQSPASGWSSEETLQNGSLIEETRIEIKEEGEKEATSEATGTGSEPTATKESQTVRSHLRLAKVGGSFQGAQIGCRARQELGAELQTVQNGANNRPSPSIARAFGSQSANLSQAPKGKMIDDFARNQPNNEQAAGGQQRKQSKQLTKWLQPFELKLGPKLIEIVGKKLEPEVGASVWRVELLENERVEFMCRSSGSSPPARLTWTWTGRKQQQQQESRLQVIEDDSPPYGQASASLIQLAAVSRREHLTELLCTATNEQLPANWPNRSISAKVRLLVKFKPAVRLLEWPTTTTARPPTANELNNYEDNNNKLGSKLSRAQSGPNSMGGLKCLVQSNPPINQLVWLVNEQPLAKVMAPEETSAWADKAAARMRSAAVAGNGDNEDNNSDEQEEEADELLNWRIVPILLGAIDGSKYKLEGSLLTVMNLTKLDSKDEYKCLAINSLGESSSLPLSIPVEYRPTCVPLDHRTTSARGELEGPQLADLLLLGLKADRVWQVSSTEQFYEEKAVGCLLDASPTPSIFTWSFMALPELLELLSGGQQEELSNIMGGSEGQQARLLARLNESAALKLDSGKSGELRYADLLSRTTTAATRSQQQPLHGFLLCRAQNSAGWQERPCLNLLTPSGLDEPSAGNCTIEPFLEESERQTSLDERRQQHIAINVDCSRAKDKDRLLFQLAIERRDAAASEKGAHYQQEAPKRPAAATTTTQTTIAKPLNRRILFTELASSDRKRLPIGNLLDWSQLTSDTVANEKAPNREKLNRRRQEVAQEEEEKAESGGKIMTLEEQLELLNELKFTIRASNLVSTSEPHAIYGSELRLHRSDATAPSSGRRPDGAQNLASGAVQVSRSTSHESALEEMGAGHVQQTVASAGRGNGSSARSTFAQSPSAPFAGNYEISITIAAICGTVLLSMLTLTLIVVVLRSRTAIELPEGADEKRQTKGRSRRRRARLEAAASKGCSRPASGPCSSQLAAGELLDAPAPGAERANSGWRQQEAVESHLSGCLKVASEVDYLAPAASLGKKRPASLVERGQRSHSSHLSLTPATLGFEAKAASETLYVIGANGSQLELTPASVAELSLSRNGELESIEGHSCDADYQLMRGDRGRQLLSYCSPNTCTGSSHCDEQSLTLTSEQGNSLVPQTTIANYRNGIQLESAPSSGTIVRAQNGHYHHNQQRQQQLQPQAQAQQQRGDNSSGGETDGAVCNTMYLFSFL